MVDHSGGHFREAPQELSKKGPTHQRVAHSDKGFRAWVLGFRV